MIAQADHTVALPTALRGLRGDQLSAEGRYTLSKDWC